MLLCSYFLRANENNDRDCSAHKEALSLSTRTQDIVRHCHRAPPSATQCPYNAHRQLLNPLLFLRAPTALPHALVTVLIFVAVGTLI